MKLLSVVGALAVVFALTSCNQDMMETTYTPDNNNVTFEMSTASFNLEGQPIVIKINRGVANDAISIPLTLTDPTGTFTINKNSADFAAGEFSTEVQLSYNLEDLKPIVNYPFTLSFNEADMAISGSSRLSANCQMPLVYKDWGKVSAYAGSFFGYVPAEKRTWTIQLADFTSNYFKIKGFFGGEEDIEFNIQNGKGVITAPGISYYNATDVKDYPMAKVVTGAVHPSYGVVTAYLDIDPACVLFGGLNEDGTLQLGSIMQFDTWITVSAGYFGWYTHQIQVTAVN